MEGNRTKLTRRNWLRHNRLRRNPLGKTGLMALLLAAVLLPGCGNPFNQSGDVADEPAMGTFVLTIGNRDLSRTIAPVWPEEEYVEFDLSFHFVGDPSENFTKSDWDGEDVVLLAGDWLLTVYAFHVEGGSRRKIARAVGHGVRVSAGAITGLTVNLNPIPEGHGTFAWNISVANVTVNQSRVRIYPQDSDNPLHPFYEALSVIGSPQTQSLPSGVYNVVFTISVAGNNEDAVIREVLHIHPNMTSSFRFDQALGSIHFPTSLQNIVLGAINAGGNILQNFDDRGIRSGHFGLLGIEGIDATSFDGIANSFTDLRQAVGGVPVLTDTDGLRILTDAALVGIRANTSTANHPNRNAARTYISGLVENGTAVVIPENNMWPNTGTPTRTGVTVRVGPYDVPIIFVNEVYDFTVTFDANGGPGATPSLIRVYDGQVVPLPGGAGSRSGYNFVGWNTHAGGGGRLHLGGSPFTVTGNVTLFATWAWIPPVAPPALYQVTLDSGAGVGGPLLLGEVPAGTEIILPPLPGAFSSPAGSGFSGWSAGAGTLPVGAPFIVNGPTTLTAQWVPAVPEPVYHTITLNPNGGIGAPIIMRVLSGSTITLPASGFTRQWHDLVGWATTSVAVGGAATHGTNASLPNVAGNIILHAVWYRPGHTVTFDPNDGTGTAPGDLYALHGNTITLPGGGGLNRVNHIFIGWNTLPEGGAGTRLGLAPFLVTASITLFAEWVPEVPTLFTVTFAPNGGVREADGVVGNIVSSPVPGGTSVMLSDGGFTRANYAFMGWSIQAAGGNLLPGLSPFTVTGNITLHAQWRQAGETPPPVFTVSFNPNDGTGNPFSLTPVPYNTQITLPSGGFTRDGWALIGWARTTTEAVRYTLGQSVPVRADTALYAVWGQIIWPTGLTATFGQTLADVPLLNVGTPGIFTWTGGTGTSVGNVGQQTHNVTFTPASSAGVNTVSQDVTVTVNRAAGAPVNAPALASRTINGIVINAVTSPGNGQTVEYAISTTSTPPGSGWQPGLTFTGLLSGTRYYIFARSAANDNFNAGAASAALVVVTLTDIDHPQPGTFITFDPALPPTEALRLPSGETITINVNPSAPANERQRAFEIDLPAGTTALFRWYVNGVLVVGAGNPFTLTGGGVGTGAHLTQFDVGGINTLFVTMVFNGIPYGLNIPVTVVNQ